MAFSRITSAMAGNNTSQTSWALAAQNVTTGNLICGAIMHEGAVQTLTSANVTDTAGNTYVMGPTRSSAAGTQHVYSFYCLSATGNASNVITVTLPAARTYFFVTAAQYSSGGAVSLADSRTATSAAVTTVSSPSLTTSSTNGLIYAASKQFDSGTVSAGTSTTAIATNTGFSIHGERLLSSAGSNTVAFNHSASTTMTMVALAFNEGGGDTTAPTLTSATGVVTVCLVPA